MDNLKELVGHRCVVTFLLPVSHWPIEGWPAFAKCEGVDSRMVKLNGTWYSLSIIERICIERTWKGRA